MSSNQPVDHYADRYWNDLPAVLAYLCRRATGDPTLWWMDYVKTRYATPSRRRALVIGCGNGWVERDLFDRNVALAFDAFDASETYLQKAESLRGDRVINYLRADFAGFVPEHTYDLIINVAALHHAQHLYRMTRVLAEALEPNGIFANWDYVGPSRNQYSDHHVALMRDINASLMPRFQTGHPLRFSFEEIIPIDPTEAVHAAEIVPALEECFSIIERRDLGGGVAYQILWNNVAEFERGDPEAVKTLAHLIELDEAYTNSGEVPVLFSFIICRPRPDGPTRRARYNEEVRERIREAIAQRTGGYYPAEVVRQVLKRAKNKFPAAKRLD